MIAIKKLQIDEKKITNVLTVRTCIIQYNSTVRQLCNWTIFILSFVVTNLEEFSTEKRKR